MNSILEVKNLNISFQLDKYILPAIFDVNLTLQKGKILSLVGESGCGKSITSMSILNLLPKNAAITSGEIIFEDKNLLNLPPNELQRIRGEKIAFIPQDPMTSLNPLYTIEEQMKEVVELHLNKKGEEAKKIIIQALDDVKIPDAKNKLSSYPHELSGGMRQRVIIAMALCCNSEIIIADEPTTALDVTVQAQILALLKQIQNEKNCSILLITHDLGVVYNISDEVAVMYAGSIVEKGYTDEIFSNPLHPYTKALLNSLPNTDNKINLIQGQPPAITDIVNGCKFHPRCPHCFDKCEFDKPQLTELSKEHFAACFAL